MDFGVEGDVGSGKTVDGVTRAFGIGEVKEAADVIVLVKGGEDAGGLLGPEVESGKGHGFAEADRERAIAVDEFAEREHRSAASGFAAQSGLLRGKGRLQRESVAREQGEVKDVKES